MIQAEPFSIPLPTISMDEDLYPVISKPIERSPINVVAKKKKNIVYSAAELEKIENLRQ